MWYQGLPITQYLRTWAPLALLLGISAVNVLYADAEGGRKMKDWSDLWKMLSLHTGGEKERQRGEMEMQHLLSSDSSKCQAIILNIIISSSWYHLNSISLPLSFTLNQTQRKIIHRNLNSELQHPLSVPHRMTALLMCLLFFRNNHKGLTDWWKEIKRQRDTEKEN